MSVGLFEQPRMGRPKKGIDRMPVRVDVLAIAKCRMACLATGEALVDYVSRVLMEQAEKDATIAAERQLTPLKKGKKVEGADQ